MLEAEVQVYRGVVELVAYLDLVRKKKSMFAKAYKGAEASAWVISTIPGAQMPNEVHLPPCISGTSACCALPPE